MAPAAYLADPFGRPQPPFWRPSGALKKVVSGIRNFLSTRNALKYEGCPPPFPAPLLRRTFAMRLHPALLLVALGAAVAGCGARSTMAPDATSSASASRGDTFVLESITDS